MGFRRVRFYLIHLLLIAVLVNFTNCGGGFDSSTGALSGLSGGEEQSSTGTDSEDSKEGGDALEPEAPVITSLRVQGDEYIISWSGETETSYGLIIDDRNTQSEHRTASQSISVSGLAPGRHCFKVYSRFPSLNKWPTSSELCETLPDNDVVDNPDDGTPLPDNYVVVEPQGYDMPLRNPYKGFISWLEAKPHYLHTVYINRKTWSSLEATASDGVDKIRRQLNQRVSLQAFKNYHYSVKYRVWISNSKPDDPDGRFLLPDDLPVSDYLNQTSYFKERLRNLIFKVGQAIDGDPRVYMQELGYIGQYGETHDPGPTEALQELMIGWIKSAFKITPSARRLTRYYDDPSFPVYNDSIMQPGRQVDREPSSGCDSPGGGGFGQDFKFHCKYPHMWKSKPISGEVAFDLLNRHYPEKYASVRPDGTTARLPDWQTMLYDHPGDIKQLLNSIRYGHYSTINSVYPEGMNDEKTQWMYEIHKALGYRFRLLQAGYPQTLQPGESLDLQIKVKNEGSAPIYVNWPIQVALHNSQTREVVWTQTVESVDIRKWTGGEDFPVALQTRAKFATADYSEQIFEYAKPAPVHQDHLRVTIPSDIPVGKYILSIAIVDPYGSPAVRFATGNYFRGGRHPLGYIGIGQPITAHEIDSEMFDDPFLDPYLGR